MQVFDRMTIPMRRVWAGVATRFGVRKSGNVMFFTWDQSLKLSVAISNYGFTMKSKDSHVFLRFTRRSATFEEGDKKSCRGHGGYK
ncbi:uncharacterized protein LOC111314884 isoform X1 [Durio zibethinus]|uniref:Uncharacterized protein LOC111314884 isoform X1 n=1 Tax=Durio zibethinus TaxID=66656 RepID=A0A6P6B509_DURZI|nr:uncharacterized protein LOC111314884 isoform X1 [Durio zibethinus]